MCYFTMRIQQGQFGIYFLVLTEKERKMQHFDQKSKTCLLSPRNSKKSAYISWFLKKRAILTKNRKLSFGAQKLEKVFFYNENSTWKIWHTFSCFWRRRKENEDILNNNRTISLRPKKLEKMLFYNRNSTGKIWHTFSDF